MTDTNRERAEKIVARVADEFPHLKIGCECASCVRGKTSLIDAIAAALAVREGHVRDDKGVERKVLGTLLLTADGCVAGIGGQIFNAYWHDFPEDCGGRKLLVGEWPWWYGAVQDGLVEKIGAEYYSTREAALSAKGTNP
jgi:hypothetical protein